MMQVRTSTGFECEIDERILTDWRLTTAIVGTMDPSDIVKIKAAHDIASLLLGEEGEGALVRHVAGRNDGFVPTDKFIHELTEIVQSQRVKNSGSSQSV